MSGLTGAVVPSGDSAAVHRPGLVRPPAETRTRQHGTGADPTHPGASAGHSAALHAGNNCLQPLGRLLLEVYIFKILVGTLIPTQFRTGTKE